MKLIKLNKENYIIVDDSEIKKIPCCNLAHREVVIPTDLEWAKSNKENLKVITHSTQPLEDVIIANKYEGKGWVNIKPLSLLQIEELLFGYSVENLSESKWNELTDKLKLDTLNKGMWCGGYQHGFNAHKELVKARFLSTQLYSNENHLEWIYNRLIEVHGENSNYDYMIEFKKIIQSLQPTEWYVEFINSKLTLKQ